MHQDDVGIHHLQEQLGQRVRENSLEIAPREENDDAVFDLKGNVEVGEVKCLCGRRTLRTVRVRSQYARTVAR